MARLTFDLRRQDGDVTRLEGEAGIAVMMQEEIPIADPNDLFDLMKQIKNMPVVSLRVDNEAQLAFLLAGLLGVIHQMGGYRVIEMAIVLSSLIKMGPDSLHRTLPDDRPQD